MNIQKFQHACLVLEKENESLVIDPGVWSNDFTTPNNVVGVIITHEHADHFDINKLQEVIMKNPDVRIIADQSILDQIPNISENLYPVKSGDTISCGEFNLRFLGGQHAVIHPDYPVPTNLGVIVDDGELYYPGDSFVLPDCQVKVLAVPASAPWLKISEAMDFLSAVHPESWFPTHDAIMSPAGKNLANTWLEKATGKKPTNYQL